MCLERFLLFCVLAALGPPVPANCLGQCLLCRCFAGFSPPALLQETIVHTMSNPPRSYASHNCFLKIGKSVPNFLTTTDPHRTRQIVREQNWRSTLDIFDAMANCDAAYVLSIVVPGKLSGEATQATPAQRTKHAKHTKETKHATQAAQATQAQHAR